MLTVTHVLPDWRFATPIPMPSDLDAWRKLLGGPIDVVDCRRTVVPCAIVCLFRPVDGTENEMATAVADGLIRGPAVLVAGASAVDVLDVQLENWEGDEPPEQQVTR